MDKGKKITVGTSVGVKKSMHSILATREDRDLNKSQGRTRNDDDISDEDEEFNYDSDLEYDTIDFSNWNARKDVGGLAVRDDKDDKSEKEDNDEESPNNDYSKCSMNVIQQEMEVEAMSAGMKTNSKRLRGGECR